MRILALTFAALGAVAPGLTEARGGDVHDGDIVLTVEAGGIVTNRVTPGGAFEESRVIEAEMFPFFGVPYTPDPGFDSPIGTFPAFSLIRLDMLDALRVWENGSFETVAPLRMEISFGSFVVESPEDPDTHTMGPTFAVNSNGKIHVHPDHTLPSGAAPGLYLLTFELASNVASIETSQPFYFLYIWEHSDLDAQAQARQWVLSNLINSAPPCPWDLTGSGAVGAADLGSLLGCWGAYTPGDACEAADFTNSGAVGASDLGAMLGNWGVCP